MYEKENLSKKAKIIIGVISILIFAIGVILIALGYNEAFYINNATVQLIFKIITFTGEETFFIILIAIFYIIYDKRFAKNLAFSLLFCAYINQFLKDIIRDPRPPTNSDPNAEHGLIETGYGFPSAHSQNAVASYGYITYEFKDKSKRYIIAVILSILIFLIAISRLIIGVHDLQDIVGGLLIGIGLLIAFIHLEPIFSEKINSLNLITKILIILVISVLIFLIGTLLFPTTGLQLLDNPPLYSDAGLYALVGGIILGLGIGYLLENKYIDYQPSEINNKQKLINLVIGLIILLLAYLGLDLIISGNVILRFIRYALLSFLLSFLVPLIFTKINRK
ncbi:MAG: phosphatase PAP2 family protein [Promethearchaeota archaeon]